jgi:hypothetical protein
VDGLSLWQFMSCTGGWQEAHGASDTPDGMTPERYDELTAAKGY